MVKVNDDGGCIKAGICGCIEGVMVVVVVVVTEMMIVVVSLHIGKLYCTNAFVM